MSNFLDRFRLEGQIAIVTDVGRGIGEANSIALADAGAGSDVVVSARNIGQLESTAYKTRQRGQRAPVLACDVTGEIYGVNGGVAVKPVEMPRTNFGV